MISLTIYGRPAPQGSKRHVGRGIMVESSKALKPWRQMVSATALEKFGTFKGTGLEAVSMIVVFYFAKPMSAKKRVFPTVKPDLDKCLRAILDGLSGITYKDDSQVVEVRMTKLYDAVERVEIIQDCL